ncbi:MAG: TetR/AcrR family transcriptional regulator C-terminal domain-containing protein [Clostridia bacterium]|nr:TetR/AcrR family transcriptional regulator C-terminal domain-containing protein [Clostridia bacterium]
MASSLTRRTIMASLLKLLEERPLSKISIKDIVEDCGINRNTFYYHFADLPDLVEAIIREEADHIMQSYTGISSLEECIAAAMKLSVDHRRAVMHIYNSSNRDIYERYMMEICEYVATAFINNLIAGRPVPETDRVAIIQDYKCELYGHIVDWLNRSMSHDLEKQFLRLCELRRGMTEEMLRRSLEE